VDGDGKYDYAADLTSYSGRNDWLYSSMVVSGIRARNANGGQKRMRRIGTGSLPGTGSVINR